MAAEPTHEPTTAQEQEEVDDGEESDVYEVEGEEEEGDVYQPEEDEEDEDADEGDEVEPENLTAELLGKQNGTTEEDGEEDDEEYEDDDDDDDDEGTAENSIDLSTSIAGSKRGADELAEGPVDEGGDGDNGETVSKKARV